MPVREFGQRSRHPAIPEVCCASQPPRQSHASFVTGLPAVRASLAKGREHGDKSTAPKLEGGFWCQQM